MTDQERNYQVSAQRRRGWSARHLLRAYLRRPRAIPMTGPHIEPVQPTTRPVVRLAAGLDIIAGPELAAVLYALTWILASVAGAWIAHQLAAITA